MDVGWHQCPPWIPVASFCGAEGVKPQYLISLPTRPAVSVQGQGSSGRVSRNWCRAVGRRRDHDRDNPTSAGDDSGVVPASTATAARVTYGRPRAGGDQPLKSRCWLVCTEEHIAGQGGESSSRVRTTRKDILATILTLHPARRNHPRRNLRALRALCGESVPPTLVTNRENG